MLWIETKEQIEGGTSGSPIVNESGELVGIVSSASEMYGEQTESNGRHPRPHLTLPLWVLRRIYIAADEIESHVETKEEMEKALDALEAKIGKCGTIDGLRQDLGNLSNYAGFTTVFRYYFEASNESELIEKILYASAIWRLYRDAKRTSYASLPASFATMNTTGR